MYNQSDTKRVLLKDKVKVFTSKGFETYRKTNLEAEGTKHLVIQKSFKQETIFCRVSKTIEKDAFYMVSGLSKDLYYIAFILNSSLGKIYLTEGNMNKPLCGNVTATKLKNFSLVDIPDDYKNPCSELDRVIGVLEQYINAGKTHQYVTFVQTFMKDLRDAIVMEIFLQPIFEKSNVHVIDCWVEEYNKLHGLDISDWNTYLNTLFESLFSQNNQLLESMKQFRMLIEDVTSIK